jgi:hypothetical protein
VPFLLYEFFQLEVLRLYVCNCVINRTRIKSSRGFEAKPGQTMTTQDGWVVSERTYDYSFLYVQYFQSSYRGWGSRARAAEALRCWAQCYGSALHCSTDQIFYLKDNLRSNFMFFFGFFFVQLLTNHG